MYACYLLAAITYFLFITSGLQGIFGFLFLSISHATFGFLTTIVYLFSQTLTLFFFVGTNTNIRDYSEKKPTVIPLFKQAKKIKNKVSGHIYLNILFFMTQSILGGAIAADAVPRFLHATVSGFTLLHFHYLLFLEHGGFNEMTNIIISMTSLNQKQKINAEP